MNDHNDGKITKICIDGNNPEMCYLVYQIKEICNTLPATTVCDADFVISQIKKKLFGLDSVMLQSLDCQTKKLVEECIDNSLEETLGLLHNYLDENFKLIKKHFAKKLKINYFMDDGKESMMH